MTTELDRAQKKVNTLINRLKKIVERVQTHKPRNVKRTREVCQKSALELEGLTGEIERSVTPLIDSAHWLMNNLTEVDYSLGDDAQRTDKDIEREVRVDLKDELEEEDRYNPFLKKRKVTKAMVKKGVRAYRESQLNDLQEEIDKALTQFSQDLAVEE